MKGRVKEAVMKRFIIITAAVFVYGVITAGTVKDLEGSVDILLAGKWAKAVTNMPVSDGDKIMTGISSKATIDTEGGFFTVNEMSMVTFHESGAGVTHEQKLTLDTGKVRVRFARLKGSSATFRVQTPKGTASVLGTLEDVGFSFKGMTVDVIEGNILILDNSGAGFAAGQGEKGGVKGKGLFGGFDNIFGGLNQDWRFNDNDVDNNTINGNLNKFLNSLINSPPLPGGQSSSSGVSEPERL